MQQPEYDAYQDAYNYAQETWKYYFGINYSALDFL